MTQIRTEPQSLSGCNFTLYTCLWYFPVVRRIYFFLLIILRKFASASASARIWTYKSAFDGCGFWSAPSHPYLRSATIIIIITNLFAQIKTKHIIKNSQCETTWTWQ